MSEIEPIPKPETALVCAMLRLLGSQYPEHFERLERAALEIEQDSRPRQTGSDYRQIINALAEGHTTVKEITRKTKLPQSTVAKRLIVLRKRGLVYATRSAYHQAGGHDNRRQLYWLTQNGEAFKIKMQ